MNTLLLQIKHEKQCTNATGKLWMISLFNCQQMMIQCMYVGKGRSLISESEGNTL